MNCPNCGVDNRQGARFCRGCGMELAESAATGAPPVAETQETSPEEPVPSLEEPDLTAEGTTSEAEPIEFPIAEPMPVAEEVEERVHAKDDADAEIAPDVERVAVKKSKEPPVEAEEREPAIKPPEVEGDTEAEAEKPSSEGEKTTAAAPIGDRGGEVPPPPHWLEEDQQAGTESQPEIEEGEFVFWRENAKGLKPLAPGTVIADRYVVVEVVDVQEATTLYYAHDLQRCWQCSFEGNASDDAFCAQCGAALDRRPSVRLMEIRNKDAEMEAGELVISRLSHEGRTFLLLAEPEPASQSRPVAQGIRLGVGQRSDPGLVRELNEDSMLTLTLAPTYESRVGPVLGLFAVADGMGGHEGGEVASRLALQVLAGRVIRDIALPEMAGEVVMDEDVAVGLRQAIMAANDEVYLARKKRENDMGTTLTTVLIRDNRFFLGHVGDCRAYRWNADGLEQLTTDHSVVASMVASGQAQPEEIYTHPHRSVIYRCIGDKPTVQVDTDVLPLAVGDRIILCSDGLWEMVRNGGIEDAMMQEADPQAASDLLVKHANVAGGEDNISVVVIQVEAV